MFTFRVQRAIALSGLRRPCNGLLARLSSSDSSKGNGNGEGNGETKVVQQDLEWNFYNKTRLDEEDIDGAPVIDEPSMPNYYDDLQFKQQGSRPYHLRKVLNVKSKKGKSLMSSPLYNKGTAFNREERDRLGLRGLLPSAVMTFEDQIDRILFRLEECGDDKDDGDADDDDADDEKRGVAAMKKYLIMRDLHDRNETLFHRVLVDNIEKVAPIVYTPTVGKVCKQFGNDYTRARGMYFSTKDHGHMASMCHNWPEEDVRVIVVTDGSRILGLGDLGANGMGIPIGKLALYCAAGGVAPHRTLPVMLDMGTNNEELLNDRFYLGQKHRRVKGEGYFNFLDEFMFAVHDRWPKAMVQFEDFSSDKAMQILQRYRRGHLCFNDDIQGTGAVAVAGVLGALKLQGKSPKDLMDQSFVVAGAGSAGLGVANALVEAMVHMGKDVNEARSQFYVVEVNGVLNKNSTLTKAQEVFAREDETAGMSVNDVVNAVKPSVLLGLTACKGLFTHDILESMAKNHDRPIIFPLSNPNSKCECTAEEVYRITQGRGIFASGSPFDSIQLDGDLLTPSQCNNMFVFPGLGFGAVLGRCKRITDKMIYKASIAISECTNSDEMAAGMVFPEVTRIREVSLAVACAVIRQAHEEGVLTDRTLLSLLASDKTGSEPSAILDPYAGKTFEAFVKSKMYDPIYVPLVNVVHGRGR
eukprot:m.332200 g.332200  ORF g.332200 m.332200 type:complete len:696 (-) comp16897_c0_seq1:864-2951(-)